MQTATIWLYWAGLMFLVGLWRGLPHVAAAAALLGVFVGSAKAYSDRLWANLSCALMCDADSTYPGTAVELRCVVSNAKWLPLWGLVVDLSLPQQSHLQGERISANAVERHSAVFRLGVNWQERATRRLAVVFTQRGVYRLGPIRLQCADPLGLYPRSHSLEQWSQVAVFPLPYADVDLHLPLLAWLGDQVRRLRFLDDPVYLAGLREYRPGDPIKKMDWKATARSGEPQIREYDESVQLETLVIVDTRTDRHIWHGFEASKVETAISLAAAVTEELIANGYQVAVHANAYLVHNLPRTLLAGAGPEHWRNIMHHLAAMLPSGSVEVAGILASQDLAARGMVSVALITPYLDKNTAAWLDDHPEVKRRLLLILVGNHHEVSDLDGCQLIQLPVWEEAAHA